MQRTTLTLDQDVAALLGELRRKRKANFKALVNEALRRGLQDMTRPPEQRPPFRTRSVWAGRVLIDSIDNIAEGEDFK
ncbi:MAG TPA: CopG family transcriptional regulator [Stellaceae bacterium]|nr:CopG family transcriptional regulator [Stellaceae bacterium]